MRFEIERCRRPLRVGRRRASRCCPPRRRAASRTARILYSRILDEIEADDYDVFSTTGPGVDLAQAGHRRMVPRRHDRHEKAVGRPARPVVPPSTEPAQPSPWPLAPARQPAGHAADRAALQQVQQSAAGDAGASGRVARPNAMVAIGKRGEHGREPVVAVPATTPGRWWFGLSKLLGDDVRCEQGVLRSAPRPQRASRPGACHGAHRSLRGRGASPPRAAELAPSGRSYCSS